MRSTTVSRCHHFKVAAKHGHTAVVLPYMNTKYKLSDGPNSAERRLAGLKAGG